MRPPAKVGSMSALSLLTTLTMAAAQFHSPRRRLGSLGGHPGTMSQRDIL